MRQALRSMALTTLLALSGCGGSDSPGEFIFNAFVGLWINGCQADGLGGSQDVHVRLTELSADRLSGTFTLRTFANTSCTGAPSSTVEFGIRQDGSDTLGSTLVIKVTIAGTTEASGKNLLAIQGGKLYLGDTSTRLPDAYPTAIDYSDPLDLD